MRSFVPVLIMMTAVPSLAFPQSDGTVPSLLTNSPFLPPGFQPPGGSRVNTEVPVSSGQFEFHGVYQLRGVYYFNLYNKRESRGGWISRDEQVEGFPTVLGYDQDEDVLTVEVAGETVALQLIDTTDSPVPLAAGAGPQQVSRPAAPPAAVRRTPPRRRVIRPTSRTSNSSSTRRPVIRPSTQNQ